MTGWPAPAYQVQSEPGRLSQIFGIDQTGRLRGASMVPHGSTFQAGRNRCTENSMDSVFCCSFPTVFYSSCLPGLHSLPSNVQSSNGTDPITTLIATRALVADATTWLPRTGCSRNPRLVPFTAALQAYRFISNDQHL